MRFYVSRFIRSLKIKVGVIYRAQNFHDPSKKWSDLFFPVGSGTFERPCFREKFFRIIGILRCQLLHVFKSRSKVIQSGFCFFRFILSLSFFFLKMCDFGLRLGFGCIQLFKPVLFLLDFKLCHGQVLLRAPALTTFQIVITSGSHKIENIILKNTIGFSQHRLAVFL